ncbi:MAG: carbohydrate ABC transporter permease [Fimbriimonadaceae bacterium]
MPRSSYRSDRSINLGAAVVLVLLSACAIAPFAWMVLASFKPLQEAESSTLLPRLWVPQNYVAVLRQIPFARYFMNSAFVALWVTFLTCLTSSMAAYAFARLRWPGRDLVFKLYLATMMVPGVVTMIPNYAIVVKLHLLDSFTGLIVPASFSAFGTFLLRQFMLTIPPALDEAAKIDGAGHWKVFLDVVMPLAKPGLATLAIFTFLGTYGSFYWPLILLKSPHMRTVPIGIMFFDGNYGRQTNLLMAAAVMAILPPVVLYLFGQKFLVKGIQLGAIKG